MGIVCGMVILLVRLVRTRSVAGLAAPAALCVVLMILLTVVSQVAVSPKMAVLRVQMGSIEATRGRESVAGGVWAAAPRFRLRLESGVLLAGMAALFWMVRKRGSIAEGSEEIVRKRCWSCRSFFSARECCLAILRLRAAGFGLAMLTQGLGLVRLRLGLGARILLVVA